jgi:hypothetical protein
MEEYNLTQRLPGAEQYVWFRCIRESARTSTVFEPRRETSLCESLNPQGNNSGILKGTQNEFFKQTFGTETKIELKLDEIFYDCKDNLTGSIVSDPEENVSVSEFRIEFGGHFLIPEIADCSKSTFTGF